MILYLYVYYIYICFLRPPVMVGERDAKNKVLGFTTKIVWIRLPRTLKKCLFLFPIQVAITHRISTSLFDKSTTFDPLRSSMMKFL